MSSDPLSLVPPQSPPSNTPPSSSGTIGGANALATALAAAPEPDASTDSLDILRLSARARRACATLGATTVGEILALEESEFLAINGCGPRTWQQMQKLAREHVTQLNLPTRDRTRPLIGLVNNPRAEKAFFALGLRTVADFLRAPRQKLLDVPGFGRNTYDQVLERIRALSAVDTVPLPLLPAELTTFPVPALGLPGNLSGRLACMGCTQLGEVLALPPKSWNEGGDLGPVAQAAIKEAVGTAIRTGLDNIETSLPNANLDYPSLRSRMVAPLDKEQKTFFTQRIGFDRLPRTIAEMASIRAETLKATVVVEDSVRTTLLTRAPGLLGRLRDELSRELQAFEGVVTGEHLAPGTMAHTLAKGSNDRQLPLRLLVFAFPKDFYLHDGCLTSLPRGQFQKLWRKLKRLTAPHHLPVPLETLETSLDGMPRGLLQYLLRSACHLTVVIDPERGEMIQVSANSHSARLRSIFDEEDRALPLDDVVFHYRDRFGRANKGRLLTQLRRDGVFLEIGPELWTLRERHLDEIEMTSPEAERMAVAICAEGGIHDVHKIAPVDTTERSLYLTIDCLKRNPSLRSLGRGEFCPALSPRSQVMEELALGFRRAMGEVPFERFIQNQPKARQRLVRRLLHHNRAFVSPAPDRVDVLTNYPFNEERMRRFLAMVDRHLEQSGGYSTLDNLRQILEPTDLGGTWLTCHLLHDVLRRHGVFELLPGGLVARDGCNLAGWIQARARETLRIVGMPVSVEKLVVEAPDLAEFEHTLGGLLERDPLVQSPDGQRFQVL